MKKALLSGLILSTLLIAPTMISARDLSGTLGDKLNDVVDTLLAIILIVAVIFIIIAAFYFITAAGDPEKIKTARRFVLYAIIGVIVAVLARMLVAWAASEIGNAPSGGGGSPGGWGWPDWSI